DIKTANKVVELILKNASIAVTGIWQADDDGVLNPANIKLTPGTIIPKAVGSSGLTPLKMPGSFDVSQLVLDDLRARIKQSLLADRLSSVNDKRMTATEILERSADAARLLGAVYGRLQGELLMPLVERALSILQRRGIIPSFLLDGQEFSVDFISPLARAQNQADVQATLAWLNTAQQFGPAAAATIDVPKTLAWLGQQLGVPPHLMAHPLSTTPVTLTE
ncbi:MAG TPA: portal protein, partial [Alphaproteobacteria bacterium]